MKVYVDRLPKCCKECPCCNYCMDYGVSCNLDNIELSYYFYADKRRENCHLQSLTDYTKQVRKEVCEEISGKLMKRLNGVVNGNYSDNFINGYSYCSSDIENILDQIQGE